MIWDNVAGIYDIFANLYNSKVHEVLCKKINSMITNQDIVLECACGTGMLSLGVAQRCKKIIATDISKNMLKRAIKKCKAYTNAEFCEADILHLNYPDKSFTKVIAANVIHLLDDPYKALKELERVCSVKGKIIIPTYMNAKTSNKKRGLANLLGKKGSIFKIEFTYDSYRRFFFDAGYKNTEYSLIEGRVPCAVAVITKE
ncbi:methyltransferase domain-containing protein [Treponema sp. OMZ 792]|uniref:class I SAM-dependent methyltransferase n=1 Tax=unclassified Treponema TaxID=2638727 RepID=UPI0020A30E99|nr:MULTISPECIES: methyltransferase domain-containing protein [unclassified Treponema]UTC74559.1 methyltransferase domain-containing protein [Treponema sp. OMZ 792]UTC80954.1 class I SAM-dependent methyltransferase [Treponema sp. OMZ 798]